MGLDIEHFEVACTDVVGHQNHWILVKDAKDIAIGTVLLNFVVVDIYFFLSSTFNHLR